MVNLNRALLYLIHTGRLILSNIIALKIEHKLSIINN